MRVTCSPTPLSLLICPIDEKAGLYSISMIILPEVTPDRAKKYIAALVGCVIASAGVLGPVLGGLLTQYTSWRWVFWIK